MQQLRRVGVVLLLVVSVMSATAAFAGAPDAKKKPRGPTVDLEDACTILWPERIEKALGGPVMVVPGATLAGAAGCVATVGTDPAIAPGGTLQAFTEYPNILSGNRSARAAVEDRRAGDALSDDVIVDVDGVGRSAYFNRTKGAITVLASRKFAFTLQWARSGAVEISSADRKQLNALAAEVVARFNR